MAFLNQRRGSDVRVTRTDEAELVRIESFRLLQGQAARLGAADKVAGTGRGLHCAADEILVLFEIGPFVIR